MNNKSVAVAKSLAAIVFGLIVPVLLLVQAYSGLSKLDESVNSRLGDEPVSAEFEAIRSTLNGANDYALYNVMSAERTNLAVVTNKQVMKVTVMQLGFAVISLGLMFVILGINDGGGEGAVEGGGMKIDFKTSSTGAIVFVVGAVMATTGGVLKNDYKTVPIPGYIDRGGATSSLAHRQAVSNFKQCQKLGPDVEQECFFNTFIEAFPEDVK